MIAKLQTSGNQLQVKYYLLSQENLQRASISADTVKQNFVASSMFK